VGICKGGTMTCKADGSGFGACEGQVTPQPEDCSKPEDEDCNGFACSETISVEQLHNVTTTGIAADPATGAIYITGTFSGTATIGGSTFTSASSKGDMVLAKLDAAGKVAWARQTGSIGGAEGGPIAFHNHAVTFVGSSDGSVLLGGKAVPQGFFAARYDEDASLQWVSDCTGSGLALVGVDPTSDDAILGGWFDNLQCGTEQYVPKQDRDIFISRLAAATGGEVTTDTFSGGEFNYANAVATDSFGGIFFGGRVDSTSYIGPYTLTNGAMYVAKQSPPPQHVIEWAASLGDGATTAVASNKDGDVFVYGGCAGSNKDFGGASMPASGDGPLCIAKLSGVDGSYRWARRFGTSAITAGTTSAGSIIAVSSTGDVAVVGTTNGPLAMDAYSVTKTGFVALLDGASGAVRWVDSFDFSSAYIAFSKQDALAVTATFGPGTSDFGKGQVTTAPMQTDSVVFLIAP
jgi:hypothetical protein